MTAKELETKRINKWMEIIDSHIDNALEEKLSAVSIKLADDDIRDIDIIQKCADMMRENGLHVEFISTVHALFLYINWEPNRSLNQNVYNHFADLHDRNITTISLHEWNGGLYVFSTRYAHGYSPERIYGFIIHDGASEEDKKIILDQLNIVNRGIHVFNDSNELYDSFLELMKIDNITDDDVDVDLLMFDVMGLNEVLFVNKFNQYLVEKVGPGATIEQESIIQFLPQDVVSIVQLVGNTTIEYAELNDIDMKINSESLSLDTLIFYVFKHYTSKSVVRIYNG